MANLATISVIRSFTEGGTNGRNRKVVRFSYAGALTAGGLSNLLQATVMGFSVVEECSNLTVYTTATGATLRIYPAAPSLDGSKINTGVYGTATDTEAARMAVGDAAVASGESAVITVHGY